MKGGLEQQMNGTDSCRIADKQRNRKLYEGKTVRYNISNGLRRYFESSQKIFQIISEKNHVL